MTTKVITAANKIDCEHLLATFVDHSHYDTLVEYDCDFYAPSIDGINSEKNILFKFRKNWFTKEQQDLAYKGLREAAVETQNRGVAAGPKGTKLGGRDWVTEYQEEMLEALSKYETTLDGSNPITTITEKYKGKDKTSAGNRGSVWLKNKVTDEGFIFEEWLNEIKSLSRDEIVKEALRVKSK